MIDYAAIAELYDVYVTADYEEFFTSAVRDVPGPVLELMAGTGRLSIPLIQAGARLTCVDGAASMLAAAWRPADDSSARYTIRPCAGPRSTE